MSVSQLPPRRRRTPRGERAIVFCRCCRGYVSSGGDFCHTARLPEQAHALSVPGRMPLLPREMLASTTPPECQGNAEPLLPVPMAVLGNYFSPVRAPMVWQSATLPDLAIAIRKVEISRKQAAARAPQQRDAQTRVWPMRYRQARRLRKTASCSELCRSCNGCVSVFTSLFPEVTAKFSDAPVDDHVHPGDVAPLKTC